MFTFFSYSVPALIFFGVALALCVIWALLPGFLAKSKGRSFWGFFLLGILSPLVVSVIVLCLKDRTAAPAEESAEAVTEDAADDSEAAATDSEEVVSDAASEDAIADVAVSEEIVADDAASDAEAPEETAEPADETAAVSKVEEATPANKNKKRVLITVIVSVIAIAAISVCIFFGVKYAMNSFSDEPIFDANGAYGQNDVTALDNYSVSEASPFDENMRAVVAIDRDGKPAVTNADMQIWYWNEFSNFVQQNSSYISMLLDFKSPLSSQLNPWNELNFEQYFLQAAADNKCVNYALAQAAYADGYTISEKGQQLIDDYSKPDGSIAKEAEQAGCASVDEFIQNNLGDGVTLNTFIEYIKECLAHDYMFEKIYNETLDSITDDAISAYYDEHAEEMEANRILKVNNVSVRHILIAPDGEQDPETGEYSEEAWAAAEEKANEVYAQWEKDPTEENFAALATEYTADGSSAEDGGLYENFGTNAMVEEFSDWSFDQSRQYGDTGIVKTTYGYHIMFFVEQTDTKGWEESCKNALLNETISARVDELCAEYPLQFDYTKIRLFDLISKLLSAAPETGAAGETAAVPEG